MRMSPCLARRLIRARSTARGRGLARVRSARLRPCFHSVWGAYDHEDDCTYLPETVRIVDLGDADIVHTDTQTSHENIREGVRAILDAGALPVVLGGDHCNRPIGTACLISSQ
jgi:arginase family enzyme